MSDDKVDLLKEKIRNYLLEKHDGRSYGYEQCGIDNLLKQFCEYFHELEEIIGKTALDIFFARVLLETGLYETDSKCNDRVYYYAMPGKRYKYKSFPTEQLSYIVNIYKISQIINKERGFIESAIVIAVNEDDARLIHPINIELKFLNFGWESTTDWLPNIWVNPSDVIVEYLGIAKEGSTRSILSTTFYTGLL